MIMAGRLLGTKPFPEPIVNSNLRNKHSPLYLVITEKNTDFRQLFSWTYGMLQKLELSSKRRDKIERFRKYLRKGGLSLLIENN